jgi:hypothetical protein
MVKIDKIDEWILSARFRNIEGTKGKAHTPNFTDQHHHIPHQQRRIQMHWRERLKMMIRVHKQVENRTGQVF